MIFRGPWHLIFEDMILHIQFKQLRDKPDCLTPSTAQKRSWCRAFLLLILFSCMHVTLQVTMSVGWSVGQSICRLVFASLSFLKEEKYRFKYPMTFKHILSHLVRFSTGLLVFQHVPYFFLLRF